MLEEKAFEVVSSWEHFAILSLLEIKGVKFTGAVIARRLNLPMGVVLEALSRLQALGLAHETSHGWRATGKQLSTSQDVPSASLRAVHRQYIDRATYSLEHHPVEERDITGITMAIDKEKLGEAKRMIKAFRRELSDFLETGTQSEVYRLNVQLFPLKK